jgi:hypothetical protein
MVISRAIGIVSRVISIVSRVMSRYKLGGLRPQLMFTYSPTYDAYIPTYNHVKLSPPTQGTGRGGLLYGILCLLFAVRPLGCSWGHRGRQFRPLPGGFGASGPEFKIYCFIASKRYAYVVSYLPKGRRLSSVNGPKPDPKLSGPLGRAVLHRCLLRSC